MQLPRERKFLFVDDYGMGGIWIYVHAKNPSDVVKRYPKLQYVRDKPKWLIDSESEGILLPEYDLQKDENQLNKHFGTSST